MAIPNSGSTVASAKPNILFIQVDEMRFPMGFPEGICDAAEFLRKFMPNTYSLWQDGVKFSRFYTAASDCTPARATVVTGLYAYQTYSMVTRANPNNATAVAQPQPQLSADFPTYGKLLRDAGYDTPLVGKWHLSNCPDPNTASREELDAYLQDYGFDGLTVPDPLGVPGHGVGEILYTAQATQVHEWDDSEIAEQAVNWLSQRAASGNDKPFCLSVGFINPHDKQFFWGGTEAAAFLQTYANNQQTPKFDYGVTPSEGNPPKLGYALPANWQSQSDLTAKVEAGQAPKAHLLLREVFSYLTGGVTDSPDQQGFTTVPTPIAEGAYTAVAPFDYWTRSLDLYTQLMTDVDGHIGTVINNIPEALRDNLVVVLTSDHGDYASSHGLQGKGGTVYEECYNVPLIVRDSSGRFTGDIEITREQLFSSVDLLPMLVSLGHQGSTDWLHTNPDLNKLYGRRADLLTCLRDAEAPGREYVVFTTDEYFPVNLNYLQANQHVVGLVTARGKLGAYCRWRPGTTELITQAGEQVEYFDYTNDQTRLEIHSTPDSPKAHQALKFLFDEVVPNELEAPMPKAMEAARAIARKHLLEYLALADVSGLFTGLAPFGCESNLM